MARVQSTMPWQAVNQSQTCINMNLAHTNRLANNVFSPTCFLVVYCVLSLRLSCFVVYSAFNVDTVTECHCYIIYIKILFSNNSFISLAYAEFDDSFVIYLTLCSVIIVVLKTYDRTIFSMIFSD